MSPQNSDASREPDGTPVTAGPDRRDRREDDTARGLRVAVTGPTGTFGQALVDLLQADPGVERVVGIARRPFDPAARGWTKLEYRQGDVRDPEALAAAFEGADVVVHLAFLIVGGGAGVTRAINVEGTLHAFRAAAAAGAQRFVYASSVAAYGFHRDNPTGPQGMAEQWPVRPADRLFYAQEKAELEQLLEQESEEHPELATYLLRPPIVLGPDAVGAKGEVPPALRPVLRGLGAGWRRLGDLGVLGLLPWLAPDLPVQLVHQDDVAEALRLCVHAAGPPGAYNVAGDGIVTGVDVVRELGLRAVPVPGRPVATAARLVSRLPLLPQRAQWVEAFSHPAIMDTTKARTELGWTPRHSALDCLRETLRPQSR